MTILLRIALLIALLSTSLVSAAGQGLTLLSLCKDPLLVAALYSEPHRIASGIAQDGSVSVNTSWEKGQSDSWYIEQQRYGGDLVQAGICTNDEALISEGLKILNWGYAHQGADGSFPGTGDPFHSVSMFVEGAARANLLLKEYDRKRFATIIEANTPRIRSAAYWLLRPEVQAAGRKHDAPYTHRRFILAAALAESAALTGDRKLDSAALEFARDGLSLQTSDGINPEKGGFDVSYQLVGLSMLERYYVFCQDQATRRQLATALDKGLCWFLTKVDASGAVDITGSTRVGNESGRTGKKKTFDYKAALQALANAGTILGNDRYRIGAETLAKEHGWLK